MALPFFVIIKKIIQKIIIWLINKYQNNISPIFGHHCRFQITCSQYSIESIRQFGILKGIWVTLLRILQCHPLTFKKNKNSQSSLNSNFQDIINMSSQRYLFIIIFFVISFILWQTWQIEYNQNKHETQKININNNTCSSPYVIKNVKTHPIVHDNNNIITVKTDVFLLKINRHGGNIEEAYLINHLQNLNSKEPFHLLNNTPKYLYQTNNGITNEYLPKESFDNKQLLYTTSNNQKIYVLTKNENTLQINLIYHDPEGITYTKNYHFNRGDYAIHINYNIKNMSIHPLKIKFFGNLIQSVHYLESNNTNNENSFPLYSYQGAAYSTDKEKYQKYSLKDMKHANLNINTNKGWIAMLQKYFVTAWIPHTSVNNTFYTTYFEKNNISIGFVSDSIYIPTQQQHELQSILWIGPKIQEDMKKIAPNLDLVIDYGWLWFISQPLFKLLKFIYYYVNNWGISIIIITLGIRLLMYPLTKAQYTSMAKIRMLQPKISLIQQEYKYDKYQYHQKTIELYKKEKVNPLGGCLPLLIQMPIFLALYYMLSGSVELRHAKFIFWINDLSSKDPFYILPILMGITMFFIQKISPTTMTDPMQKKIMNITLIIFTIFFLWFPSGLVLYYIISNIITIIQQQIIFHGLEKKGLHYKKNEN